MKRENREKKEQSFQPVDRASDTTSSKNDTVKEEGSTKSNEKTRVENNLTKADSSYNGTIDNAEGSRRVPPLYRPFQDSHSVIGTSQENSYKDEFSVYGEHIGNQLRSLTDRHSLTVARYEIDQVIFRAIMGEYYVGNCQCCFPETSKESAFVTRSSPQTAVSSPAFQPYHRPVAPPPVHPQPIRPAIETWTDLK